MVNIRETLPVLDIEHDDFTLTDIHTGAIVAFAGETHTITKVEPYRWRPRFPYQGVNAYDGSGWGHTILMLHCDECEVTKCFASFDSADTTGWFRLYHTDMERFYCGKGCLLAYLQRLP